MKTDAYRAYCDARARTHQLRQLQETQPLAEGHAERDGGKLINFSGNDYLGLSRHPLLINRAHEYTAQYGAGSTASRLVSGNLPVYARIETRLAEAKGFETALVMSSGYQANIAVLSALADAEAVGRPVTVLADRLCHNSLLQGAILSGARLIRFRHNDYDHLTELLQRQTASGAHIIIVSESVFGMDGDCADISVLTALSRKYDAMLYVDEAHATGLYGANGFGFTSDLGGSVDIAMGTFGKALGSFGAYIACNRLISDYLIQRCGGLIYSTALPPAVLGSIDAAIELVPKMETERQYLRTQSARVRQALAVQGWNCGASITHIIPIILGSEEAATLLAQELSGQGILAPAIRPPTVPRGSSRLRFSLSAAHAPGDIDRLIEAMVRFAPMFALPAALAS